MSDHRLESMDVSYHKEQEYIYDLVGMGGGWGCLNGFRDIRSL